MRVTVLGSAASHAGPAEACAGHHIEVDGTRILLDCANGVLSNLGKVSDPYTLDAVFITHDWGKGDLEELGRDNHARAAALNRALTSAGVPTWFDEEKMEGQVDVAMAEGLEESALVLVCVTQRYMEKVKGKNQADNCFTEFAYAVRAHTPAEPKIHHIPERCEQILFDHLLFLQNSNTPPDLTYCVFLSTRVHAFALLSCRNI